MMRIRTLRGLVAALLGAAGAGGMIAVAGCATNGSPEAPSGKTDGATSVDAGVLDGPRESGPCAADDCVAYPAECSERTLCRAPADFDPRANLLGIWASGPDDVWVAGTLGTVLHHDGTAWSPVATGRKETFHSLWGMGRGDVWVASSNEFLLHSQATTLATGSWDRHDAWDGVEQVCPISGMWGTATKGLWGALQCLFYSSSFPTPTVAVLHSSGWKADGGPAWEPEEQSPTIARTTWDIHAVFGFGADDVWVGGSGGVLFRRSAGQWLEVNSRAATTINGIGGTASDDVWLVGDLGLVRHWNGTTMETIELPPSIPATSLRGVWASAKDDVWFVGDDALLVHHYGTTFTRIPVGGLDAVIPRFRKVWASETTSQIWVVGDGILLGGKTSTLR